MTSRGFGCQVRGPPDRSMKPAAKILYQVNPVFPRDLQPLEDRCQIGWDRAPTVGAYLPPGPVQQLEILRELHR